MRSNYKLLGPYIQEIDERNIEDSKENLLGVSTRKIFIDSKSNTVGADFSNYKKVKRRQFVYVPDTGRRGDKIGIALLDSQDHAMVSQVYTVFEVKDTSELLPEYLMMWFRRTEFDRYARFKSQGSVREIFGWEDLCHVELPIPSPAKQKEIVKEYQVLVDRIKLDNKLIQTLDKTAQTIYKRWFIDFEFPDENGNPYKTSGRDMHESELGAIPADWKVISMDTIVDLKNGKTKPETIGKIPVYGGNGIIGYVNKHNTEDSIIIGRVGENCGNVFYQSGKCWVSDNAISATSKYGNNIYAYFALQGLGLNNFTEGSGQPMLTQQIIGEKKIIYPNDPQIIKSLEKYLKPINAYSRTAHTIKEKLIDMLTLLLGRLSQLN